MIYSEPFLCFFFRKKKQRNQHVRHADRLPSVHDGTVQRYGDVRENDATQNDARTYVFISR